MSLEVYTKTWQWTILCGITSKGLRPQTSYEVYANQRSSFSKIIISQGFLISCVTCYILGKPFAIQFCLFQTSYSRCFFLKL
jgi:hypothetical protein